MSKISKKYIYGCLGSDLFGSPGFVITDKEIFEEENRIEDENPKTFNIMAEAGFANEMEGYWSFYGTEEEAIEKIESLGFKRSPKLEKMIADYDN